MSEYFVKKEISNSYSEHIPLEHLKKYLSGAEMALERGWKDVYFQIESEDDDGSKELVCWGSRPMTSCEMIEADARKKERQERFDVRDRKLYDELKKKFEG